MRNLDVIIAAAAGALVGAGAALLLAPKKGSETRQEILDFVKRNCPVIKDKKKLEALAETIENEIEAATGK
ncbi:MAG: YtxH domain-containing protein [Muribaculaceae bacterium]|nr:YtxH domain-containing protein [Muribaculaceae bacterium]